MSQAPEFPQPEPTDTEDVVWALQTAGTMWGRGDTREAVRWLRRAAEAAGDSGNDLRAVGLARTAADLSAAMNLPPSIPPPAPPAPSPSPAADQTARVAAVLSTDAAGIPPMEDAERSYTDHTVPDMDAVPQSDQRPPPRRSSPMAAPPPPPQRSSPSAAPPPSQRSSPSTAPAALALRPRQALRVAVEPSSDDKGLLLVRPLAEGEPVPEGMHEAILSALEAGAHLLSRKR